jgi:hypothetical protein
MKITKTQLKQIIKEELGRVLKEGPLEPGIFNFNAMDQRTFNQLEKECKEMHRADPEFVFKCMSYKAAGLEYPPQEG